jgi:integrase
MKKPYKGTLFKRGPIYWIDLRHKNADGKSVRMRWSLDVTTEAAAIAEATKRTQALKLEGAAGKLEKVLGDQVAVMRDQVAKIEADRMRARLNDAWEKRPYKMSRARAKSAAQQLSKKTVKAHQRQWNAFLEWLYGARPGVVFMDDVTAEDAECYSMYCQNSIKCGPTGYNDRIDVCRVMFDLSKIEKNPFAKIARLKEENEGRDCLTLQQVERILAGSTGEIRLLVVIGLFTGLRLGDAVNLLWKDISGQRLRKKTGKTGKLVTFPIHPYLAGELDKLTRPNNDNSLVVPELAAVYKRDPSALSRRIRRLFQNCGIEVVERPDDNARGISRRGFHSLRYTFVSSCARKGIPIGAISRWCGHSTEVDKIYQNFEDEGTDARIIDALSGMSTGTSLASPQRPTITVEAREIPSAKDQLRQIIDSITEERAGEWLASMQK